MSEIDRARALLHTSAGVFVAALSTMTAADLDRPTPCPRWNVRSLVSHVAESAEGLTSRVGGAPATSALETDVVSRARETIDRLLTAVDSVDHPEDAAASAAHDGAIELTAHGWDLGVATSGAAMSDEHAGAVLALAQSLVDDEVRAQFFGPVVATGADRSAVARLVAFLGRDPDWTS